LIRWIILYLVIYLESIFCYLFDWIPIIGLFIPTIPSLLKIYVLLPHSQGYLRIYKLLEQVELDEHTGRLMKYFQKLIKLITLRTFKMIEIWVDMI